MGIGESWKAKREAMGKTLEEAAADLRISRKYLRGIEEGNYAGWPERVFSAGFIRAYAVLLSEDPEPVLTEYYRSLDSRGPDEPAVHVRPEWIERERQRGSRRTTYAGFAAGVLLLGIFLAWYSMRTTPRPPPAPDVRTAPGTPDQPVPGPAGNAAVPAADRSAPHDNAAAAPPPVPRETVTTVGGAGPVKAPYQLLVEASEQTWLMYGRDDAGTVDVMLYPGDRISIQAQKTIYLKLGNAGGVVGTLNGKPLPPFGTKGQVKEFRLGP